MSGVFRVPSVEFRTQNYFAKNCFCIYNSNIINIRPVPVPVPVPVYALEYCGGKESLLNSYLYAFVHLINIQFGIIVHFHLSEPIY